MSISTNDSFNTQFGRTSFLSRTSINELDGDINQKRSEGESSEAKLEFSDMQRQHKKILYIAKEIMSSEKVYVEVLKLLNIEFRNFIQAERQKCKSVLLPTEDFLKIFSNLPELLILNSDLLRDFENRVQNGKFVLSHHPLGYKGYILITDT